MLILSSCERWLTADVRHMETFREHLSRVCAKPTLYVGYNDIRLVRAYFIGLSYSEIFDDSFNGLQKWIETRYGISHPGWHWPRILVHSTGSHFSAIKLLPSLFDDYLADIAAGRFHPGKSTSPDHSEPTSTPTKDWHDQLGDREPLKG
jgi:hypothetical protein